MLLALLNVDLMTVKQDILHLDETAIKNIGIKNSAHRAKIVSSLVLLKAKRSLRKFNICFILKKSTTVL